MGIQPVKDPPLAQNPVPNPDPQQLTITVDGKSLPCRPDTSLAVALWDHGLRHLSHSHKYGRPRGVTCARGHCTNCLMRVDGVPNVRTCETSVRAGMVVNTQDTGTFYGAPMQKLLSLGSAWMPVGFYYKWFTRPASLSRFFLDRIRPMTGVGRLPDAVLPVRDLPVRDLPAAATDEPEQASTDLGRFATVIIGGGASGLQAASHQSGSTLLIDDSAQAGGQRLLALRELATDKSGALARFPTLAAALERLESAVTALPDRPDFRCLAQAKAVAGYYPAGLLVRQGDKLMTARFDKLVWAAGALDSIGLFPGNDTPGLFGPRAMYRLLTRDGLQVSGRHVLLVGGGFDFWLCAALLASRGATLNLVVTESGCQSEVAAAVDLKWSLNTGLKLKEVKELGGHKLQATFEPRNGQSGLSGSRLQLEADLAVICKPGKPAYDIPYQLGADLALVPERGGYVPRGCDATTEKTFAMTLPGGAEVICAGETLGLSPTSQVTS